MTMLMQADRRLANSNPVVVTPRHCRSARSWFGLSQVAMARQIEGINDARWISYFEKQDERYPIQQYGRMIDTWMRTAGVELQPKGIIVPIKQDIWMREGLMSPAQCRAARGWLNWNREYLAELSDVAVTYIYFFEKNRQQRFGDRIFTTREWMIKKLSDAFQEAGGMRFVFDKSNRPIGIRQR